MQASQPSIISTAQVTLDPLILPRLVPGPDTVLPEYNSSACLIPNLDFDDHNYFYARSVYAAGELLSTPSFPTLIDCRGVQDACASFGSELLDIVQIALVSGLLRAVPALWCSRWNVTNQGQLLNVMGRNDPVLQRLVDDPDKGGMRGTNNYVEFNASQNSFGAEYLPAAALNAAGIFASHARRGTQGADFSIWQKSGRDTISPQYEVSIKQILAENCSLLDSTHKNHARAVAKLKAFFSSYTSNSVFKPFILFYLPEASNQRSNELRSLLSQRLPVWGIEKGNYAIISCRQLETLGFDARRPNTSAAVVELYRNTIATLTTFWLGTAIKNDFFTKLFTEEQKLRARHKRTCDAIKTQNRPEFYFFNLVPSAAQIYETITELKNQNLPVERSTLFFGLASGGDLRKHGCRIVQFMNDICNAVRISPENITNGRLEIELFRDFFLHNKRGQ